MRSILTVIGTRPEAIKLSPVLIAINKSTRFESKMCLTRQHTDLLDPYLLNLGINPHYEFEHNEKGSTLHHSAAHILKQFDLVLRESKPNLVLVQGDTTTTFMAALAAFYSRIPVAHVEAGLRTGQLYSPWPEEVHRCLIDRLTTYFFAPTEQAKNTLVAEGVSPEKIWVVGNTSIDAIRLTRKPATLNRSRCRSIVVTIHRRENHGKPLEEICHALGYIAETFSDVKIQFVLHPNPDVREPAIKKLSGKNNIELLEPMDHASFMQLLDACLFIITDSGGIQEEAPYMGKPVLIIRETTERPEGVQAGTARLVGTKMDNIIANCKELLEKPAALAAMSRVHYPYGDGYAAEHIVNILDRVL